MVSWRNGVSLQAQQELDELLGVSLAFSQQELGRHGKFYPYAVAVTTDGRTEMIAARPSIDDDEPDAAAVIESCELVLADRRDQFHAIAVVADVHVAALGSDAIEVRLEHAEGVALAVLLPYAKRRARATIDYGALSASAAAQRIWT